MNKPSAFKNTMKKPKKVSYYAQLQQQKSYVSAHPKELQVVWQNTQGTQCRRIINPNRCFCAHSFELHEVPATIGPVFCTAPGCRCKCYQYVPYYDIKCMCRHSYKDHDCNTKMCKMCKKCLGFVTNWCCKCGIKYQLHQVVFETKKINQNVLSDRLTKNSSTVQISTCEHERESDNELENTLPLHSQNMFKKDYWPIDARTYEMGKYKQNHENKYYYNERSFDQHKQKQILRINQKYSNNSNNEGNFQKMVQNHDENAVLGLYPIKSPDLAHKVTPLQLLIRPHNYSPIKLSKLLQKEYRKHEQKQKNNVKEYY